MSLVTIARYRVITGDTTSASATVETALADAQDLLEEELGRVGLLEDGEHTERLQIHYGQSFPGGRVYPTATPITAADDHTLVGTSALDGASPSGGPFDVSSPTFAEVTYTGGWSADNVPESIERDIAWAAYSLTHPTDAAAVPVGATSRRIGDAAVTYAQAQTSGESGIAWSRRTLRHRKRRV